MWYTLTGNFGDLLPINYWSKPSLIRKYHSESLNLKQLMYSNNRKRVAAAIVERLMNKRELDLNLDSYENLLNSNNNNEKSSSEADCESDDERFNSDYEEDEQTAVRRGKRKAAANAIDINEESMDDYMEFEGNDDDDDDDEEDDEDLHELREQLDMHSMLSKSLYEGAEFDEPIVTAEQVLNEIDSMMNMVIRQTE
jgi:hypothetical protein